MELEPSKVDAFTEEADFWTIPRQGDGETQISQFSCDNQEETSLAITASNNSFEEQLPETQTVRGDTSPIYLYPNDVLILEELATVSHTPSCDEWEIVIPENDDGMWTAPVEHDETNNAGHEVDSIEDEIALSTLPVEHGDTKDENDTQEDDDIKNDIDEGSWPPDTDPKFLAEAAEYRRRGPVYTGEYRVKRLGRGRLDYGPTLSIAPEAEELIMGTEAIQDVSLSSLSVAQNLGYESVSDAGADVFGEQPTMKDDGWPLRNEPSLPDAPKDAAVNTNDGNMREAEFSSEEWLLHDDGLPCVEEYQEGQDKDKGRVSEALSDTQSQYARPVDRGDDWPLRNDSMPYVHEAQEGEDKGKDRMSEAATAVQSEQPESEDLEPVTRNDGWPVRADSLPHFQNFTEGEASGGQFAADLESEFQGRATRYDGWPVRLHSLPSFQKLSEASKDEGIRKKVLQDVRAQFLGTASMRDDGPVRVDSLPDVRGQRTSFGPLAHSRSANDLKPWTRSPETGPSFFRQEFSSSQSSLLRDRLKRRVHFSVNTSTTSLPAPDADPPPRPPRPRISSEVSRFIARTATYGLSSAAGFIAPVPFIRCAPRSQNTISNPTFREQLVQDWLDEQYTITENLGHTTPSTTRPLAKRALKRLHKRFGQKPKTESQE